MVNKLRKAKIFLINGLILTLTAVLMRGAGFIFNIYIANQVGSEAIGVFTLVMSVYLFAITIATSGISLACTCLVSEALAKNQHQTVTKAVRTCIFFSVILGLATMVLIISTSSWLSQTWLKGMISAKPLIIIGFGLPLIAVSSVLNGYFSAIGKSYQNAIAQIVEFTAKLMATLLLLNLMPSDTIESICVILILADVLSEIFSFSLNLVFYFSNRKLTRSSCHEKLTMKRQIFRIAFPVAITSYIKSGLSSLKQFLIPLRLELSGLTYSMAVSSYGMIQGMVMPALLFASVFIGSFSNLLVPEFSRLLAGNNPKRMKTVSEQIFHLTFVFSIGIGSLFFFFSNELSLLIYQNMECAKWLRLLAPMVVFIYVDTIFDSLLKGINEQFGVMCCNILDLVLTITFIYFLVPHFGMVGYVFTICFSEILNFTISSFQLKRRIPYRIYWIRSIFTPLLISGMSYLLVSWIGQFLLFLPFLISTIVKLALFLLIFSLSCLFLKAKQKSTFPFFYGIYH